MKKTIVKNLVLKGTFCKIKLVVNLAVKDVKNVILCLNVLSVRMGLSPMEDIVVEIKNFLMEVHVRIVVKFVKIVQKKLSFVFHVKMERFL